MPACSRPGWAIAVLSALALAACERPAAPAAATPTDCLTRAAADPPTLPWTSLHARDLAAAPLDAGGRSCVSGVLGTTPFAIPQAYDAVHAPVQRFHGEDAGLRLGVPAFEHGQLVRLDAAAERGIWLLRIGTGLEMEGGRYDLLFTTGADGRLRDSLLIGADGARYRRDANLLRADRFAVIEQTGREAAQGPTYAAAFTIGPDGRIALDPSGTAELRAALPAAPGGADETGAADEGPEFAQSIEEIDGAPGDLAAIRRVLFADGNVVEESITAAAPPAAAHAVLALGSSGIAGFELSVLEPADAQPTAGRTVYRIASVSIPGPPRALGAKVGTIGWEPAARGVLITLPIDYAFERPGGDARTGQPDSEILTRVLRLRYADGQLHRSDG
ncbi:MAG: hypothetical protein DI564_10800 [Rhodanobacter denitrificans]|uniref:Uncharacterized protein n=1 Tax=Rhodanobacter denitrificans TaxID=666685 RepID=A0A2W5KB15_9GAMM|nr:MAG: hypothetical protein DI564_10800 [Rhodanobacter denitrificans]